jgi:arginase family enzyme
MRLISREVKPAKIIEVGTRSVCQEELDYAKNTYIEFVSIQQIRKKGTKKSSSNSKPNLHLSTVFTCLWTWMF